MSECDVIQERMPQLLTESLRGEAREQAHQHIESCGLCGADWEGFRETWETLGAVPVVEVPARVRRELLARVEDLSGGGRKGSVIAFHRRPAIRWLAQAAGLAVVVGGSYFVGIKSVPAPAAVAEVKPAVFRLAETSVVPAQALEINGRPEITNVRFLPGGESGEIGLSFDTRSRVTVKGKPNDPAMVTLLASVVQDPSSPSPSRGDAIQWVRQMYGNSGRTNHELVAAVANVLKNDTHEGVRLKAVEAMATLNVAESSEAQSALILALRNDPNPAVRMKAVEALAGLARSGGLIDGAAVETLWEKARDDENPYVRVKAAEALSQINL